MWGVGYYGLRSELDRLRKFFDDEDLRSDALFAYALAIPAEVSRGRMKGLLARIEKDAHGLSEMEEELVKAALDERLMLAGKEPAIPYAIAKAQLTIRPTTPSDPQCGRSKCSHSPRVLLRRRLRVHRASARPTQP